MSTNYTRGTIKENEKHNHIPIYVPCQFQISEYAQPDELGGYFGEKKKITRTKSKLKISHKVNRK